FDSEQFLNDAIYINDFIQGLMARVENKNLFPMLHVLSIKCRQKHIKLENVFYIRDNRPIEENIKKVTEHYKRYLHFYKELILWNGVHTLSKKLLIILGIVTALFGCVQTDEKQKIQKVAMLTEGPIEGQDWEEKGYKGL